MKNKKQEPEIWRDLKDPIFKEYYQVSNVGRLVTKRRKVTRGGEKNRYTYWKSPKIVCLRRSKENPHLFASLYADEIISNKTKYIHRLVAEAFIKRPSRSHVYVTHIDGDYDNNFASNLKWITASENSKSNIEKYPKNALNLKKYNERVGYYDMLKSPARKKKKSITKMKKWGVPVKEIARIYKCSSATIYNIVNNK